MPPTSSRLGLPRIRCVYSNGLLAGCPLPLASTLKVLCVIFIPIHLESVFYSRPLTFRYLRCRRRTTNSFNANKSVKHASFIQYVLFRTNYFQWEYPAIADRYLCGRRRNRTSITLKTIGCFIVSFYTTFLTIHHIANRFEIRPLWRVQSLFVSHKLSFSSSSVF